MNRYFLKNSLGYFFVLALLSLSCKKVLEVKSNQKLATLTNIGELQSLLEDQTLLNDNQSSSVESAADDYFLETSDWKSLSETNRNLYTWNKENQFVSNGSNDWVKMYTGVFYANTVLDHIDGIARSSGDEQEWNTVKGHALFLRSRCFFQLALIWAEGYDKSNSKELLGIPLRLNSNYNENSVRANLYDTYNRIVADLKTAAKLLPVTPIHVVRPSKPAAYGYLARVYLSMGETDSCFKYVNLSLNLKSDLLDYNSNSGINPSAQYSFLRFNPEVVYDSGTGGTPQTLVFGKINPDLYDSYHENDLRKTLYHRGNSTINIFKGSYQGTSSLAYGIATDELYIMRAECYARLNRVSEALADINKVLVNRWKKGMTFIPVTAVDSKEALHKILIERRKSLVFRGLRWMDIKRLNREGAGIILKRNLDGQEYILLPNSLGYAMPIPEDIIAISGMKQNPR